MICVICRQAETIDGQASIVLKRGEVKFTVNHVPAQICPRCGEEYVEAEVAVKLLQGGVQMSAAGEIDAGMEYSSLP